MCDKASPLSLAAACFRLTLFETAGCATVSLDSTSVMALFRLTLFETAGCATRCPIR